MITEDYISFETAKLLKEKGFDVDECEVHYYSLDHTQYEITLQMAMNWLEIKNHIAIIPVLSSVIDNEKFLWNAKIVIAKTGETYSQKWVYENRERACEVALKYALKNLI